MPQRAEVVLSEEERTVLERWARRPKSAQALAQRCRIVLAAAEGRSSKEIASALGCSRSTVGRWRGRFAQRGVDGLQDEPRPGKPRSIGDDDVERSAPVLPLLPGVPARQTHDYVRHGTTNLYAALNLASGQVIAEMTPRHRAEEFRRFLNLIDSSLPAHLDVHVVLDNPSTHKAAPIQRWLLRHPRFTLHFTPTYSSWLNLVERWFAELSTKWIKRGTHRSVRELVASIRTWIANWNDDPRPFVWHKTADQILDSLAPYCQRINDSRH
jgi:transposase